MKLFLKKYWIFALCAVLIVCILGVFGRNLHSTHPEPTEGSTIDSTSDSPENTTENIFDGSTTGTTIPDPTVSVSGSETTEIDTLPSGESDIKPSVKPGSPSYISVTGVTLGTEKLTLKPGDSQTLYAIIEPENASDKSVIWSSSDSSVASVSSSGVVTAHKNGAAYITVKTNDGDFAYGCLVAVATEKLTASATHDIYFSISNNTATQTLEVTITATGGTEVYTYNTRIYRNGALVSTKTRNYFTIDMNSGSYKIEITVSDSGGNKVYLDPIHVS